MEGISISTSNIGSDQIYLTASIDAPAEDPTKLSQELYREVGTLLKKNNLKIFHERVFGNLNFYENLKAIRRSHPMFAQEPFTYIEGDTYWGGGVAGLQIHAVREPARPEDFLPVEYNDAICGRLWRNHDTTYISLQMIYEPPEKNAERGRQTAAVFDRINAILNRYQFNFRNVVRTWIYLSDILDWYDEFNQVRTSKFQEYHLFNSSLPRGDVEQIYLPASTGISGKNPFRSWSAVDVLAVGKNSNSELTIYPLTHGSQKSAFRYGSAFSRGMCLQNSAYRQLLVSGTAAIDMQGESLFLNDSHAQMKKTFEIVNALIKQEGAQLKDICSATIFLKNREDIAIYKDLVKQLNLQQMPAIIVIADVCREELLFELDAIAVIHA